LNRNTKLIIRLLIELGIILLILFGFAYDLTGSTYHELLGIDMVVLIIFHHVFNYRWYISLKSGKYNHSRYFRTVVNLGLAASSLIMLFGGLLNSYVLEELLGIEWRWDTRTIHTVSAYWYLVFASIHLGMHWPMIKAMTRNSLGIQAKLTQGPVSNQRLNQLLCLVLTLLGFSAIYQRQITQKLFATMTYDFWDFEISVWPFFLQLCAVMFVFSYLVGIVLPKLLFNRKTK
jgi:hypothetical protein